MDFSLSKLFKGAKQAAVPQSSRTAGIDVGSAAVKVVEIEDSERALVLKTYGELQLGPYEDKALGNTVKLNQEKRIEAIVDVNREAGVTAKRGVLALPMSSSFMTVVPIVNAGEEDLKSKIRIEAKKYIPLPLSDMALDWTPLSSFATDDEDNDLTEVLIAAIENNTIADYAETVNAIGMQSSPSEIEAFSLVRALERTDDTTLGLIDLGARTSKLYIVREGQIERIHRLQSGGVEITSKIAKEKGIDFESAENLKRNYNPEAEDAALIKQVTTSVMERPVSEFKRIIEQYETRNGAQLGRIALTGGVSSYFETVNITQDLLGRVVEVGDPFAKVAYPAFLEDTLKSIGPTFGVSMGAALRYFAG